MKEKMLILRDLGAICTKIRRPYDSAVIYNFFKDKFQDGENISPIIGIDDYSTSLNV